tara:strand:+ start:60 stop:338 length:279 start_codon:yes stop_codon:yes gene_type:complete
MAFFKIRHPDYDEDKVEDKIVATLKKRNVPIKEEREFVDRYNMDVARKEIFSRPMNRFKCMLFKMPRWLIDYAKLMPFYKILRKLLNIDPLV